MSGIPSYSDLAEAPWDGLEQPEKQFAPPPPPDETTDYEGLGRLLELAAEDPEKCAKQIVDDWERQDPAMTRRKVFWDRNTLWLRGIRGVRAYPVKQDLSEWRLFVPMGAFEVQPVLDRCDELCEKVTSHKLADPPKPDPEPASDKDDDRDAAELSKRILEAEASESGFNYQQKFRRADRKASVYGSGFVYLWTDPTGGGPDGQGGWNPKLCGEVLTGLNVRFHPEKCEGITDAEGVSILWVRTLGQLRDEYPELRSDSEDYIGDTKVLEMANWRTLAMNWVLPWYVKLGYDSQPVFNDDGQPADSTLIGLIARYQITNPAYPKGAYLLTAGDAHICHAGTWEITGDRLVDDENGQQVMQPYSEPLDLPIAQFRQFDDTDGDDPYGYGLVPKIGPADEVRGTIVLAALDHIDRYSRPNTYIPMGSLVQPEDMQQRNGTPMYYNANNGGTPIIEQVPTFDTEAREFFALATDYENNVSALGETAQAIEAPNVTSGVQAQTTIATANLNMATQVQNLGDGIQRTWRLMLQQYRAFWTSKQLLKYTSEDGSYTIKPWTNADLGSTCDVRIAIGSFTQKTPEAKLALGMQYAQLKLVDDPDELKRLVAGSVNPLLGLEDNPVTQRIRSQIAQWKDGPPEGWDQAFAQFQQAQQMVQAQAQAAQQQGIPPQPAPPVQPPPSPFVEVGSDHEPKNAVIRHRELMRVQQMKVYAKFSDGWRQAFDAAYEGARRAAGIMTTEEMSQAQASQVQAQAQAKAQGDAMVKDADAKSQYQKDSRLSLQEHEQRVDEEIVAGLVKTTLIPPPEVPKDPSLMVPGAPASDQTAPPAPTGAQ